MIFAREPVTAEGPPPIPGDIIRREIGVSTGEGVLDAVPARTVSVRDTFG